MEISLDAIVSLIGLLLGGGGGAFFTWRYMRRKARAEAVTAEVDAAKELQDLYQQMLADAKADREDRKATVEELRQERDHYKNDRDELREKVERLTKMFYELKTEGERERSQLRISINRLNGQLNWLSHLTCGDLQCKHRQQVIVAEELNNESATTEKIDIKPYDDKSNS